MLIDFPVNEEIQPISFKHFPTRQQAVIWRNWELVSADRLAAVLETDVNNITKLAQDMGLRVPPAVEESLWLDRGYITIIRANWHLLPYEQLLTLLGWTEEKLAFSLKEDDFLWTKLGKFKPAVEPVNYRPLTEQEEQQTLELRRLVEAHFPHNDEHIEAKPFDFLEALQKPAPQISTWPAKQDWEIALDESWSVVVDGAMEQLNHVPTFIERFVDEHEERWGKRLSLQGQATNQITLRIKEDTDLPAESHHIEISRDRIDITSVDDVGLLRGLQWLQKNMELSSAPYVPLGSFKRNTRFELRYMYSYFAVYGDPLLDPELDPYPESLLARLSKLGVNGVWLQAVLYNMIPFEEAQEFSVHWEKRIEGLRKLVDKAAKYGIGIYLYYNEPRALPLSFFEKYPEWKGHVDGQHAALCTSSPEVLDYVRRGTSRLFQEVPKLAGLFTITMSENMTHCYSRARGGKTNCPRCAKRKPQEVVAELNRVIEEGVHSVNENARVICWTWGFARSFGWNQDMVREAIADFPDHITVMSTSEDDMETNVGGIKGRIVDYSISNVGPGEKSLDIWQEAGKRNLQTAAKVQFNNTWEMSSVPYLPVLDLVNTHLERLADAKVNGLMLSWTLGGYPSPNLELAAQYYWEEERQAPSLKKLAEQLYGTKHAALVAKAWNIFSQAFQHFPFHVGVAYLAPQNIGPANILYEKPSGYKATMVGIPYDDLEGWRSIYPEDVFEQQFEKLSREWSNGVHLLRQAEIDMDDEKAQALRELFNIATAVYSHFRSTYLQIAFVRTRDRYLRSTDDAEKNTLRNRIVSIIDEEIAVAKQLYHIVRSDSRIGYEASNHYFYTSQDLKEKVINAEYVKKML